MVAHRAPGTFPRPCYGPAFLKKAGPHCPRGSGQSGAQKGLRELKGASWDGGSSAGSVDVVGDDWGMRVRLS